MPTLPSGTTPEARDLAGSFGADPDRYDRARPRYPDELITALVAASPGPDVLDVGIGTGIVARQLLAAGCTVLGVDVDARMAEWSRRHGLDVEVSAFEQWDPAGRTFDAVVAGQTWHWVDPVAGAAKAAEALRPGGRLAVFWNAGLPPSDVGEASAAVYDRVLPGSLAARWAASTASSSAAADGYSALCAKAADGMRETGGFGEPEVWRFEWERTYTRDEWLDVLPTTGAHTLLPPELLAEVLAGVGAAIDAVGGGFTARYTTDAVVAART